MLVRVLGFALLVIPFLPLALWFDGYVESASSANPRQWFLGLLTITVISALQAVIVVPLLPLRLRRLPATVHDKISSIPQSVFLVLVCLLATAVLVQISWGAYGARPQVMDAVVQQFQATIYARGALFAPSPEFPEFFVSPMMVIDGPRWYSQYPPGHALLLAVGVLFGVAWIVPIALSVASLLLTFYLVKLLYGEGLARYSMLALLCCPFFLFMGASDMNHVTALFFVLAAAYCLFRWEKGNSSKWLFVMGVCAGSAFVTRPLCAVAAALAAIWSCRDTLLKRPSGILLAVIGGALPIAFLGYLNYRTTGDPLVLGYVKQWGSAHGLGFHTTPYGQVFTPFEALGNQLINLALLQEYLLEWPIPSLTLLSIWLMYSRSIERVDRVLLLFVCAYPAIYFFYWHRDSFLGPRFLYCVVPFLVPLVVRSIAGLVSSTATVRLLPSQPPTPIGRIVQACVLSCLLYSASVGFPLRYQQYAQSLQSMKFDTKSFVTAQGLSEGIVFIPVSWGSRIVARLVALGLPQHEIEILYRKSDHCLLEQAIIGREEGELSEEAFTTALAEAGAKPVQRVPLNADRTLRLRPNTALHPLCAAQVRYDEPGYGVYLAQLLDNDPFLENNLIFAIDLGPTRNQKLINHYPSLPAYLLRNNTLVNAPSN